MTDVVEAKRPKPRSKANRRLRYAGSRASVTLVAAGLCGLFVLPLIYMVSAAFNDSNSLSTPGAPLYPSINKTVVCPDASVCTYTSGYSDVNNLRYSKAPALGPTVATVASTSAGAYASADVTTAVTRAKLSFAVSDPSATTPLIFQSREGANKPQLLVTVCASAKDTSKPDAPTGLKATPKSYYEIDLTWTASDSTDVATYKVYRDDSVIATDASTSWSDIGVTAATDHVYRVSAVSAAGNESDSTAPITATSMKAPTGAAVLDDKAPTVPTNVKATATAWNSVSLSWSASTDNVAVVSYSILRNGGVIFQVSPSTTSVTDVTALGQTKYTYTIMANDAAGNVSPVSTGADVTTPAQAGCTPTTTTLNPTADSYVDQSKPDANFGSQDTLLASGAQGATQTAYLMFDLTATNPDGTNLLPDGAITQATLNLYSTTASTTGFTVQSVDNTTWGEFAFVQDAAPTDLTGQKLPIYVVPGHGELGLVIARTPSTGLPSLFIDPTTKKQVALLVNISELSKAWEFHITIDNFGTAMGWADKITSGDVTNSSLGGNFGGFARFFFNTLIIAGVGTFGATVSAIIVAFGFARFKFPGRDILFLILIGTILLPFQVTLIPQFIIFQAIGWSGTWLPLIVPHYFSNAYNVFLLRQYFLTLPRELDEAAMMDGATPLRILRSVIIPQSWPAIMSVVLFHFFFAWNDFLAPLLYLTGKPDLYPIAIGLNYFNTTFKTANAPAAIQAGALFSLILPVFIFFLAQRVFMRGVVISGVEK
jgi:ABC-type glycerol-3-phosphate transport system permease component